MYCIYKHRIEFEMLELRENEIALRKLSGPLEGTLPTTLRIICSY